MPTMKERIARRVAKLPPGATFTPKDLLTVASRGSIDMALATLVNDKRIRRLQRGLYDVPKTSLLFPGEVGPDIHRAARALARRFGWKIVPEGAWAANLLGLSTQVPSKVVYLSDGPFKRVPVGRRTLQFKHASPQRLSAVTGKAALAVQALQFLGKDGISRATLLQLRRILSECEKRRLVSATRFGVGWVHAAARKIAEDTP